MRRDYEEYPQNVPVDTSVGPVLVSVTDGTHLYVSTKELNVGPLLTYRGATYYLSGHWYRDPQTREVYHGVDAVAAGLAPEDTFGIYLTREGHGTVTQAARRALVEAVQSALTEWAADPDSDRLFAEGAFAHSSNALRDMEDEATKLSDKLTELNSAITAEHKLMVEARKQLARLAHPAGKGTLVP